MALYSYDGPVLLFTSCIENRYHGETMAPSEKKARSNITYAWKMAHGYTPHAKIILPGKLVKKEDFN